MTRNPGDVDCAIEIEVQHAERSTRDVRLERARDCREDPKAFANAHTLPRTTDQGTECARCARTFSPARFARALLTASRPAAKDLAHATVVNPLTRSARSGSRCALDVGGLVQGPRSSRDAARASRGGENDAATDEVLRAVLRVRLPARGGESYCRALRTRRFVRGVQAVRTPRAGGESRGASPSWGAPFSRRPLSRFVSSSAMWTMSS